MYLALLYQIEKLSRRNLASLTKTVIHYIDDVITAVQSRNMVSFSLINMLIHTILISFRNIIAISMSQLQLALSPLNICTNPDTKATIELTLRSNEMEMGSGGGVIVGVISGIVSTVVGGMVGGFIADFICEVQQPSRWRHIKVPANHEFSGIHLVEPFDDRRTDS